MSNTFSDTRSSKLADAIRTAIQQKGSVDPEAYLGIPLADGYAIQADVFRSFGQPLPGSKLSLKSDACHSAPLISVVEGDQFPHRAGLGIEVELAFTLGKDTAAGASRQDVVDAISSVRFGVELCGTRYEGGARGDQALAVADLISNIGYVLGPELDRGLLAEGAAFGHLSILIDGQNVYDKAATHADVDPVKSLVVLAGQAPLAAFPILKAGQVITTGTLCGMILVAAPGKIEMNLGGQPFTLTLS